MFGTPHDVDVGALCRAYHIENTQLEVADLAAALAEPFSGMRVLEVKADRSSLRSLRRDQGGALTVQAVQTRKYLASLKSVWRILLHGPGGQISHTRAGRFIRWARIAVMIVTVLVTMQSVLLIAGAWRSDLAIESNMGSRPRRCSTPGRGVPPSNSSPPTG